MRVLHVIPSLSRKHGGPSVALPLMAKALVEIGVEIDVATTDDDGPGERITIVEGQPVCQGGTRIFYFRKQTEFYVVSGTFRAWFRQHARDYDLIHIHALFSYVCVVAAREAFRQRVPYVVRPLGVLNQWGVKNRRKSLKALSLRFVEGPILRRAAAMHYTSEAEAQEAGRVGATAPAVVIPIGIDTEPFRVLPPSEQFLQEFPALRGGPIVLFLSRIDRKKGLDLLLPAFAQVKQQSPTAHLVIAGGGEAGLIEELQALAERLGIVGSVHWVGFLSGERKLSAFRAARLFVLPSYSENFGIALVEALAAGLPCVTTTGVAISEDVEKGGAGLVVAAQTEALAQAIGKLMAESEGDHSQRSMAARNLVSERYALASMGGALRMMYQSILGLKKAA